MAPTQKHLKYKNRGFINPSTFLQGMNPRRKTVGIIHPSSRVAGYSGRCWIKVSHAALLTHPKSEIYQKALHRHKAINTWEKAVVEFFEDADSQTKAVDFKDGVLFVACLSKELANKIKMFAQRIIYIINQLIGQDLVFSLRVEY